MAILSKKDQQSISEGTNDRLNEGVAQWAIEVESKIKNKIDSLVTSGKSKSKKRKKFSRKNGKIVDASEYNEPRLVNSIRYKLRFEDGEVSGVGYSLAKHGIFFHHGVGKGYQMVNGKVIRTAKNAPRFRSRKPADWFNSTIDENIDQLSKIVLEAKADAVINTSRIYLKHTR